MTNFRTLATAMLLGTSALAVVSPANASAPCRDAHGRFASCSAGAAKQAPKRVTRTTVAQRAAPASARLAPVKQTAAATPARISAPARAAAMPTRVATLAHPAATAPHKATTAAYPATAHPAG